MVSIAYVGVHYPRHMRLLREQEEQKKKATKIASDKHIGPDEFSMSHVEAAKIKSILSDAFGAEWRKHPEARDALSLSI